MHASITVPALLYLPEMNLRRGWPLVVLRLRKTWERKEHESQNRDDWFHSLISFIDPAARVPSVDQLRAFVIESY